MNRIVRVMCAVGGTWLVACGDPGSTGSIGTTTGTATATDATQSDSTDDTANNETSVVDSATATTEPDTTVTTEPTDTTVTDTTVTDTTVTDTTVTDTTATDTTATDTTVTTTPTDTTATDTTPTETSPTDPQVDLRGDGNRDGVADLEDPTDDANEETWDATHGAIFLANLDDDLQACADNASDVNFPKCNDAADDKINGDLDLEDLAPLRIAPALNLPDGAVGRITIASPGPNYVRIFARTGPGGATGWKAIVPNTDVFTTADLRAGVELKLEGKDVVRDDDVWDGYVNLDLEARDASNKLIVSDRVRFRVAPMMLSHHLERAEHFYVTKINDPDSVDFRNDLKAAIADVGNVPLSEILTDDDDPWTQDFFETGYMTMPAPGGKQKVIRVNFRSANLYNDSANNPLRNGGDYVYAVLRGVDAAGITQYDPNHDYIMDSLDSFGNTETIPPFTHAGESWPLGRILRGSVADFHPDPKFSKMLESQAVQAPVYIDTSWLLVGHVDETLSFVRAPTPQGWTIVVNDPALAISTLQGLVDRGQGNTKMFVGRNWLDNNGFEYSAEAKISSVLADQDVMEETTKAIAAVDSQLQILLAATGIAPEDVIHIPYTHWSVDGYSVAYQPGTVNLIDLADDLVGAADPHGPIVGGVDVFKAQMEAEFDKVGITVMWIEDWNLYHRNLGEVHCGTNTTRAVPTAKWWETGR